MAGRATLLAALATLQVAVRIQKTMYRLALLPARRPMLLDHFAGGLH